jgi:hypothetical protein
MPSIIRKNRLSMTHGAYGIFGAYGAYGILGTT